MVRVLVGLALLLATCTAEREAAPPAESPTPEASPAITVPPAQEQAPQECVDATIAGQVEVTIRERDNTFSPSCLTVLGGQGLELLNRGENVHNFSIEGTEVSLDTPPGEATRTEAIGGVVEPGTYTFFCEYYRAEGMEGEITITEAG